MDTLFINGSPNKSGATVRIAEARAGLRGRRVPGSARRNPRGTDARHRLALIFQGAAPEKWMIDAGEYSVKMLATLYGMEYLGMAQNEREAKRLAERM